jgi:hypothetical protein
MRSKAKRRFVMQDIHDHAREILDAGRSIKLTFRTFEDGHTDKEVELTLCDDFVYVLAQAAGEMLEAQRRHTEYLAAAVRRMV